MNTTYVPSRKVVAGGISGILAWALLLVADRYGLALPDWLREYLPAGISTLMFYLVKPAQADIIRRLNDEIVAAAGSSTESAVSASVSQAARRVLSGVQTGL